MSKKERNTKRERERGKCVPHAEHVVSWTSLGELGVVHLNRLQLGGEIGGTKIYGDKHDGRDDTQLDAIHRHCSHLAPMYILISEIDFLPMKCMERR